MSFPVAIAGGLGASALLSGFQGYQQGDYESKVAKYNARVQENTAVRERLAGIEAERDRKRQADLLVSRQQAVAAANGVDIGSGSVLDLTEGTRLMENIDLYRIRQNTDARAEARLQGADLARSQGQAARYRGNNAFTGSLLTGGTQAAGYWYTNR